VQTAFLLLSVYFSEEPADIMGDCDRTQTRNAVTRSSVLGVCRTWRSVLRGWSYIFLGRFWRSSTTPENKKIFDFIWAIFLGTSVNKLHVPSIWCSLNSVPCRK